MRDSSIRSEQASIKAILQTLLILGLIAAAAVARLTDLSADPQALRLTTSASLLSDEGFYSHQAANAALGFGSDLRGDFSPAVAYPAWFPIQRWTYQLLGVSLRSTRLPAAIAGIFAACALSFSMFRIGNRRAFVFALILLLFSFLTLSFSRLALLEMPALFYCALSFLMLTGLKPRLITTFAAGILASMAVMTKLSTLPFVVVAGLWLLMHSRSHVAVFIGGFAAVGCIFAALSWRGHQVDLTYFLSENVWFRGEKIFEKFRDSWRNFFVHNEAFGCSPLLGVLAALAGPVTAIFAKNRGERFAGLWASFQMAAIGSWYYQPSRYHLLWFMPGLLCLAILLSRLRYLYIAAAGIILGLGLEAPANLNLLIAPDHSIRDAGAACARIAESVSDKPFLIGNMAGTMGVAGGMGSLVLYGPTARRAKALEGPRPSLLVTRFPYDPSDYPEVTAKYAPHFAASFDLLKRYRPDARVFIYYLVPKSQKEPF